MDEFWNEFIDRAARYTYIRNQWETMSTEEKKVNVRIY